MYIYNSNNNNYIEVDNREEVILYIESKYKNREYQIFDERKKSFQVDVEGIHEIFVFDEELENKDSKVVKTLAESLNEVA